MDVSNKETPALLVIDMVRDYFDEDQGLAVTDRAREIISPINRTASIFRENGWPVVFSTDAFKEDDFFFQGRMKPHAIRGSAGAEIIDDLNRHPDDLWLPKPRMSAFFKTDLENWLRQRNVTLCAVAGIATHYCVLTTALDALCHDFKAVILEDCVTAYPDAVHRSTLENYRKNPLFPLFRVIPSEALTTEIAG